MTFPARAASSAATATAAIASALAYPFLPTRVATHFDMDGRPDGYNSRAAAAVTLPATMLGIEIFNDRLGRWPGERDRENVGSGALARDEAVGLTELALLSAHLAVLANGVGVPFDVRRLNRRVFGTLLIALGNVLPKLPRNGLIGIRTPWTLADPIVWERTHRTAGYLLMAAGVVTLASASVSGKRAVRLPAAAVLAAVGLSTTYSLFVYARQNRRSG